MTDTDTLDGMPKVPDVVRDDKNRPLPEYMEDRELLIELVTNMRAVSDAVSALSETPMVRAMQNGGGMFDVMRAASNGK